MAVKGANTYRNPSYLESSVGIFMFFCSWGIWWSFFSRWLTDPTKGLGMTSAQQGEIYSINSLVTLILMFVYGVIQDSLVIKRRLVIVISCIAALVGPFAQFIYAPMLKAGGSMKFLGALLGSVVLSAGFMAGCSLVEALTERCSRFFNFKYGQSRAWGSFGYAIVALIAGRLFNVNMMYNFWLGSLFGFGMLCVYAFWRPAEQVEEMKKDADPNAPHSNPSVKEMVSVLGMGSLWAMVVFIFFTNTFYTVFDQQMFPNYYVSLFSSKAAGNDWYSNLNAIQVFCESAMMGIVPVIMDHIGVRNSLLLGGVVMCLRIGLCGIFHDPVMISVVKMFHAIEVPLFSLPTFRYFTLHYNTKLSATLYMVGYHVASSLGQTVMSTPLGLYHDKMGDRVTFLTISAIVLAAVIYGLFVIKKDDQQVGGDPFIRVKDRKKAEAEGQAIQAEAASDELPA
ncbi:MFS transporter [Bifidobacterium sp. ESL0800]|uniref:MFS transporter n=1 Tax=Bifidobacterium sp. ESL0800 TaxID=2983236 RepID=UPI0023F9DF9A|nr:MFS transporter [Bifidobacterium sp. ESL0800]WEV76396.1 MFS transporter [Bifidobacterium sp. ESL0800]